MLFEPYLSLWELVADGLPVHTHSSDLLPVRYRGEPAMLKVARAAEEIRGAGLLLHWAGEGAVRVLAQQGAGLLMERVEGKGSLAELARTGQDDQASRIICAVARKLHGQRRQPLPEVVPLATWFSALDPAARTHGGILRIAATAAGRLLGVRRQEVVLHGDLHHGNVLDGGKRGWLAIDPKGLLGERGFEYANLFCNPDFQVAASPGRLSRQVAVVAATAGVEPKRLLEWVLAWAGLSAAWSLEEGQPAELPLSVARLAAAELLLPPEG